MKVTFEEASQILGARWCLTFKVVEKILRELDINPSVALKKACEMGVNAFTDKCLGIKYE